VFSSLEASKNYYLQKYLKNEATSHQSGQRCQKERQHNQAKDDGEKEDNRRRTDHYATQMLFALDFIIFQKAAAFPLHVFSVLDQWPNAAQLRKVTGFGSVDAASGERGLWSEKRRIVVVCSLHNL